MTGEELRVDAPSYGWLQYFLMFGVINDLEAAA